MPAIYLTDAVVRSLTSDGKPQRDVSDKAMPKLQLRITSRGKKSWTVRYEVGRRKKRFNLGAFPAVSLAHARRRAAEILGELVDGADPQAKRKATREAPLFVEVAARYIEEYAKVRKRSWKQDQRNLSLPDLRPVQREVFASIDQPELRVILKAIARRAPVYALGVQRTLSKMWNWALAERLATSNPLARMEAPGQKARPRRRWLAPEEIRRFWAATHEGDRTIGAAVRLWLLLAQRMEEVAPMKWADLESKQDGFWWVIPETDTKNKVAHRVPILGLAYDEIVARQAARREDDLFVFPSPRRKGQPIEHHPAVWLRNMWARADLVGTHGKDLRRTWATLAVSLGVDRSHVGRCLNHSDPTEPIVTGRHYDVYHYDPQKLRAFRLVDAHLRAILAGEKSNLLAMPL